MIKKIAVLGGGISGLSSAYFLSKRFPNISIHLYEGSKRLGGWIQTTKGLEHGPRTIRPGGLVGVPTLQMIQDLGLKDEMVLIPKTAPAARNRFLYLNGKLTLVSLKNIMSPSLFFSALKEPFVSPCKEEDESIESFFSRRLNPDLVDNLISAMIYGIYAGDVDKLSIRSCLPSVWEAEKKRSLLKMMWSPSPPIQDAFAASINETSSIYTFKNGLQTLVDRLKDSLDINYHWESVSTLSGTSVNDTAYDYVISALPHYKLRELIPGLPIIDFASVNVIHLNFQNSTIPPGFGYLIPRSQASNVLGVIFDSFLTSLKETRLTVMTRSNDMSEAIEHVCQSLNLKKSNLVYSNLLHQHQCIPQYTVGHYKKLNEMEGFLKDKKMAVVGSSYFGVGINDCIYHSKRIVDSLEF